MPDVEYDQTSDWFSLGICIYQFLTGHTPFRGGDGHSKKDINRAVLEDVSEGRCGGVGRELYSETPFLPP